MQRVLQGLRALASGKADVLRGHVWQGRYKSPLVDQERSYLEAGRDIERNPLRAKLVTARKDSPWSSCLSDRR